MAVWIVLVLWLSWVVFLAGQNAPPNTVFYQCNRTSVSVAVKKDPLDNRMLVDPGSLTLGKCFPSSITALRGFLVFEYSLYDCRFSRMDNPFSEMHSNIILNMTQTEMSAQKASRKGQHMGENKGHKEVSGNAVKFFTDLVYKPGAGAYVFPQPFRQQINCVSDISRNPTPFESAVTVQASGTGQFDISSQIMNDDFSAGAEVKDFFLGAPIFLAISVATANHMPLQIFVDECIVAPTRDLSILGDRYILINNHGCFVDGKVAASRFVEPLQLDTVKLTFPAMKFLSNSGEEIYLHFKLIVWDPRAVIGLKMCSYFSNVNSWQLLGNPQSDLCRCCDSICRLPSRRRREAEKGDPGIIHTMVLGPFKLHSPAVNGSLNTSNETKALDSVSAFPIPPAAGALFLELAVLLLLSVGVAVYGRTSRKDCGELEKRSLITNEN
ncbi:zona pellucida sperm-binding protein 3-like [Phyllobates terribilis]|uniref:zona pellucida sperm-binding protein 3-like n=1 Tax=Phyllobates terribilis TaxID=111132 RepID=UPI003CCAC7E4